MSSTTTTRTATAAAAGRALEETDDPREQITVGVVMADGRLAPRSFASRAEAEAWARPEEQVVEWNFVCRCDA
ncbi:MULTISPECIES: hypothetical protein [unclassified Pseudactinotalea]|uniref:hypothetical protein n=1 Tax=unclassified Pseudactinotalea TaxID=2649176 RepID=UPI00128B9E0B|nr:MULTISPECIES: hypothetical protein [unclassified Pseudactinotalea]MPV49936.1 hypothetical protein [Pseudactinotalea sp. HY160]QGH69197.1 hypothetical protein GCE65_06480 [Pseudactinotalea sp. HY158]